MGPITLYVDIQNQQLVQSPTSQQQAALPSLFENNSQAFVVVFLLPTGVQSNPFAVVDASGVNFRMSLGGKPLGTGGPDPAALQDVWVWTVNAVQNGTMTCAGYVGVLNMNTPAMVALIGTSYQVPLYFELDLVDALGKYQTILQEQLQVFAVLDKAGVGPNPANTYITAAQIAGTYVKKVGAAGETVTFVSPNGLYQRTLGIADDGTPTDIWGLA